MSPTISEIALKAGVSAGTVSRILNGKNKENRPAIAKRAERIRGIAAELGYRPNGAARSIFTGRFNAAAFITCSDIGADWFPRLMLHGLHAGLQELGLRLVFTEVPAASLKDPDYVPELLQESTVDGLMVYPNPAFSEHIIPYFEHQRQPVVWLNLKRSRCSVYPDEYSGARLAVNYLVQRGHRKIGYFPRQLDPWDTHFSRTDRREGFVAAMEEHGLSTKRCLSVTDPSRSTDSMEAAHRFLDTFPDATAVVCYEQEEATVLHVAAASRGIKLPEDLTIMAFHEGEVRATTGLTFPTMIVPFMEVGRQAVMMLQQMIDEGVRDVPSVAVPYREIKL